MKQIFYRPVQPWIGPHQTAESGIFYREYPVPGIWRPYFTTIWTLQGPEPPAGGITTYHVVPDACSDLIFDLESGEGSIFGTLSQFLPLSLGGRIHILGLRMMPHVLPALVGFPASTLRDATPTFEEIGSRPLQEMVEKLAGTTVNAETCETLITGIGRMFRREALHPLGKRMVEALIASDACVDRAARSMGLCPRQLQRLGNTELGLPPKRLSRILRAQHTLSLLFKSKMSDSMVAVECGYSDQSHMIREFETLTGYPPSFWKNRKKSDLFNSPAAN